MRSWRGRILAVCLQTQKAARKITVAFSLGKNMARDSAMNYGWYWKRWYRYFLFYDRQLHRALKTSDRDLSWGINSVLSQPELCKLTVLQTRGLTPSKEEFKWNIGFTTMLALTRFCSSSWGCNTHFFWELTYITVSLHFTSIPTGWE